MLVGVVEEPGAKEKRAFHNLHELWDILNPIKNPATQRKKRKNNSRHNRNSKQS